MAYIFNLNQNDILLGRGGHSYLHTGNEQLREIARSRVDDYRRATKKVTLLLFVFRSCKFQ